MKEAGVLGKFIPEFARIIGQMQFDMYHIYTTDEHILVALGIVHSIERGDLKEELPRASQLLTMIESRDVLYFSILCHDIAKGKGQHQQHGADIAKRMAAEFGFSEPEQDMIAWLVRHQDLFSEAAFKRDLSDRVTIERFVGEVQSLEKLRMLFVLTVADIRAVGPNLWNAWKGSLLRELYARAEHFIQTGSTELIVADTEELKHDMLLEMQDSTAERVQAYIDQGSPGFLLSRTAKEHAALAGLITKAEKKELPFSFQMHSDTAKAVTELVLIARDRLGLLSDVAGALSLSGINILGARIFTLKNGWAVQLWQLQDINRRALEKQKVEPLLAHHLRRIFAEQADVAVDLAKQRPTYASKKDSFDVTGQVFIENQQSATCTIIEIIALDSPGLLHAICHALQQQKIGILSAHINTYGERAVDVFYVKDSYGFKISHADRIEQLRHTLLESIAHFSGKN